LVWEEIAYGVRRGNVVRSAAPSGGWWRDAEAEVVVVVAVVADGVVAVVVAVDTEGNQRLWHCCGWVLVAYPGQQGFGGTSNDMRRTLRQEIRGKHRGKPQQPGR